MKNELIEEKVDLIIRKLFVIDANVKHQKIHNTAPFIDNSEFIDLMKISKRTAQTWRDNGIIAFSQVGNKIYYRTLDIEELINKNYKPVNLF